MTTATALPAIVIENITPAIAEQYLTKNVKNRRTKELRIARYARDMIAGNWQITGEPIKFDVAGNLADGQNRLLAIIRADVTVTMVVVRGVTLDAMSVMDSGAPRSNADTLGLNGFANGKDLAAVCNIHAAWVAGGFTHAMASPRDSQLSHSEVLAHMEEFPNLAESTAEMSKLKRALRLPIGALATAHHAFVEIDPDAASDFFDRIKGLRTSGAGDPIATLHKRVAAESFKRVQTKPSTALFFMFRTWNAYIRGEELSKLQLGSSILGWTPIPAPLAKSGKAAA
ncbi:hypothetical protein [Glaciibacter psychrotolerans]|uniref:Uncharacterized protein n=1 Tax=Glaciibacter psychrotolerans TaxID=670054 RepID=A0A7Z0J5S8_9MICO|nr:hypothetical protein [Leifsonia psychrotolerans]NYJ19148.1 hypothetical protein [Leifsonia psychrotolerans]